MYTEQDFKTKKAFKAAVKAWNDYCLFPGAGKKLPAGVKAPEPVRLYAPGLGTPKANGTETVEGPHYPAPHTWYAQVEMKDGIVVKVK